MRSRAGVKGVLGDELSGQARSTGEGGLRDEQQRMMERAADEARSKRGT